VEYGHLVKLKVDVSTGFVGGLLIDRLTCVRWPVEALSDEMNLVSRVLKQRVRLSLMFENASAVTAPP
jgi:hypothetical protein